MDTSSEIPDLCGPFIAALAVTGASVSVLSPSGARMTLTSSDDVAARIDELQFELGEGPHLSAAGTGEITEIADVLTHSHNEWPMFGLALRGLPVGSLFCVPMRMGAVTLGVATLYCTGARQLTPDERSAALALSSAIASPAAHLALRSASDQTATSPALRREVHQATGIVLVQLNTTATIAYARLQAYAFANGRTVESVAHDVVAGSLHFDETDS